MLSLNFSKPKKELAEELIRYMAPIHAKRKELEKDPAQLENILIQGEEKARGRYKIGEGITGKVVETGEPMVVKDMGAEPLFLNRTQARQDLKGRKFAFLTARAGKRWQ